MGKKFKNVPEMIKALSENKEFATDSIKLIKRKRLSKFLFFLRCEQNFTQEELAKKIGCSQGRISKIEHADDADLSIRDLIDYADVLDLQLEIGYRKNSVKIVDLIKYHAFKIDRYLKQLTNLAEAKKDEGIINGVAAFCQEAYLNISEMIMRQLAALDRLKVKDKAIDKAKETIHISPPIDERVINKEQIAKSGAIQRSVW